MQKRTARGTFGVCRTLWLDAQKRTGIYPQSPKWGMVPLSCLDSAKSFGRSHYLAHFWQSINPRSLLESVRLGTIQQVMRMNPIPESDTGLEGRGTAIPWAGSGQALAVTKHCLEARAGRRASGGRGGLSKFRGPTTYHFPVSIFQFPISIFRLPRFSIFEFRFSCFRARNLRLPNGISLSRRGAWRF